MPRIPRVKVEGEEGIYTRTHPTSKAGKNFDRAWDIVVTHPKTKKRIWKTLGWSSDFEGWNLQKAKVARAKLIAELTGDNGELTESKNNQINLTFSEAWKMYYEGYVLTGIKSARNYDAGFRKYFEPEFGNQLLEDITEEDINDFKARFLEPADPKAKAQVLQFHIAAGLKGSPWISKSSMRTYLYQLSDFFNWCRKNPKKTGFDGLNPVEHIEKPKKDGNRERALDKEQAEKLMEALKTSSMQLWRICNLSLYTGMRLGEIFGMRWCDVNIEAAYINIPEAKGGKDQKVFLPKKLITMFSEIEKGQPEELVFKNKFGGQITSLSDNYQRIVDKLGFNDGVTTSQQKIVGHTLRHSFCTWVCMSGKVNAFQLKNLMRHKSFSTTEKYLHLMPDHAGRIGADVIDEMDS